MDTSDDVVIAASRIPRIFLAAIYFTGSLGESILHW